MFVGILLGSPEINGGTYVIYEHGSRLKRSGHRVAMITREPVIPGQYAWHPAASELEWLTVEQAEKLTFDIIVATWWQSAFMLHQFSADQYVYFVQSIESRFFAAEDPSDHDTRDNSIWMQLCESTYSYNIPMITEARWIKNYLYEQFNTRAWRVPNGIRKDIYRPGGKTEAPRQANRLRVLIEGPVDVLYKNVPRSVDLCRRAGVKDVWLMTSSDVRTFPGADRVFSRIPIERTAEIYRSCDVLLKLSYVEGMFGPPLEMFHCGGTAIVYDVTGHDEYIRDGENSYVVKRDDDDRVVNLLNQLQKDNQELERLKKGARKTANDWPDWQEASQRFDSALQDIRQTTPSTSRQYLRRHTRQLWDDNQHRLDAREADIFRRREAGDADGTVKDFVQLYWHFGEGFNQRDFQWACCAGDTWNSLSFAVQAASVPFHIRIDPSVRVGITVIRIIEIVDRASGRVLMTFNSGRQMRRIACGGTGRWIGSSGKSAFLLSYGPDPQLFLPPLDNIEAGVELDIKIKLKPLSISRFLERHSVLLPGELDLRWKRRLMKATVKGTDLMSSAGRFLSFRR